MKRYDQSGGVTTIVGIAALAVALISSAGFGWWAYNSRQDYKDNSDKKVATAVAKAVTSQSAKDSIVFAEKEKLPYKTFNGPAIFGSITFSYPKSWSAYVDQTSPNDPVKGLFYPDIVPSPIPRNNVKPVYALRVDLIAMPYAQVLRGFDASLKKGTVRAKAYIPPKVKQIPNVQTGTRLDGMIEQKIQGSMVVIKVRDKTLKIYTESPSFLADFNKIVLNSLTFVP